VGPIKKGQEYKHRYGIVMFNHRGEVLLREPRNHFAGHTWQFSKGTSEPGEHPLTTAMRETAEETGRVPAIVGHVPGGFVSVDHGTINHYYLGEDLKGLVEPKALADNGETSDLRWAEPLKALELLGLSTNKPCSYREMKTLKAACDAYSKLRPNLKIPEISLPPALGFVPSKGGQEGTMPEKDEETLKVESIARVEHVHKHVMQVLAGEIPKDAPEDFVLTDEMKEAGKPWWGGFVPAHPAAAGRRQEAGIRRRSSPGRPEQATALGTREVSTS